MARSVVGHKIIYIKDINLAGKQEIVMKTSFLCSKIVFHIKRKSFLSTIKSISQALGCTFQALGCTFQALGYTSQTLGHNFHHRERTFSTVQEQYQCSLTINVKQPLPQTARRLRRCNRFPQIIVVSLFIRICNSLQCSLVVDDSMRNLEYLKKG